MGLMLLLQRDQFLRISRMATNDQKKKKKKFRIHGFWKFEVMSCTQITFDKISFYTKIFGNL